MKTATVLNTAGTKLGQLEIHGPSLTPYKTMLYHIAGKTAVGIAAFYREFSFSIIDINLNTIARIHFS